MKTTCAVEGPCFCAHCDGLRHAIRQEHVADVKAWLASIAPQAPRTTPRKWHYPNAETFVLEHGRYFDVVPLTNEDRMYIWACLGRAKLRPRMGGCWQNSRRLLMLGDAARRFTYVEGYVGRYPVHHGWLILDGVKVVDVTLGYRAAGVRLRVTARNLDLGPPDGRETGPYFGVAFPREFVEAARWQASFALADAGPWYRPGTLSESWNRNCAKQDTRRADSSEI